MISNLFLVTCLEKGKFGPATRLKLGDLVIGRHQECDIYLPDKAVSRKHALLSVGERGIIVTDLKSLSGTWVNSERIKFGKLMPGDKLQLGNSIFVISSDPNVVSGLDDDLETHDPRSRSSHVIASPPVVLTKRQAEVLSWLMKGLQEKEVAAQMNIATDTVHNHVRGIYTAYGVHSRIELLVKVLPPVGLGVPAPSSNGKK